METLYYMLAAVISVGNIGIFSVVYFDKKFKR